LLVEESLPIQLAIEGALREHSVTTRRLLRDANEAMQHTYYDLVILNVALSDGDGFEFCARQPALSSGEVPVVFLTAQTSVADKVRSFALGAADCLTLPFDGMELKARVNARLRGRATPVNGPNIFQVGSLKFDLAAQRLALAARGRSESRVDLTPIEFKLLLHLAHHEDRILTRGDLMKSVWGEGTGVSDRTVDTHVSHLRKKLGHQGCEIQPVYGRGYRFILTAPL
jgi:DNA-binding response OmpR family regulator